MKEIELFKIHNPPNIGKKIQEVFDSGLITEGKYSDKFENMFANYVNNKHTSLVNSCTSALTLAYHLSDLKKDDEIITTPMTCMATNEPAHNTGAKLVFADIDPSTGNIDPESVKKLITKRTKAVVGVHWAGEPFDIDGIKNVVKESGQDIKIVEDAAHALGAQYKGKPIGSHSDYVCFSFQAIKHLTTVDGGAICCNNKEDDKRIKKLRWFGLDRKYKGSKWTQDIAESGYKFHMNNVNAAIGIEQMKYIDNIISSHIKNGLYYDQMINNTKIIKLKRNKNASSSFWIYTILTEDRDKLQKYLRKNGIASDVVHVRNDKYSVFKNSKSDCLKGADYFCERMLNIPVGWWLSDAQKEHIVRVINEY